MELAVFQEANHFPLQIRELRAEAQFLWHVLGGRVKDLNGANVDSHFGYLLVEGEATSTLKIAEGR
jgi:hypothetical protein